MSEDFGPGTSITVHHMEGCAICERVGQLVKVHGEALAQLRMVMEERDTAISDRNTAQEELVLLKNMTPTVDYQQEREALVQSLTSKNARLEKLADVLIDYLGVLRNVIR